MRKFLVIAVILTVATITASAQNRQQKHHAADKKISAGVVRVTPAESDSAFVGTSFSYPLDDYKPGVVKVGPRTTYLKEGLTRGEVIRLLGKPTSTSERKENDVVVTIYEFERSEHRVLVAEFVGDVLVRSRTEARDEQIVQR